MKQTNLWKKREEILRKKDWTIDEKQLKIELKDFDWMLETLQAMIYNIFWLGNLYLWKKSKVEKLWNKRLEELISMEVQDIMLCDIKQMETKEEIIEYINKFYTY